MLFQTPESRTISNVHDDEEDSSRRRDEVDPCAPIAVRRRGQEPGKAAFMPGDIVSPVRNRSGKQHEDDAEIGELLQHVVALAPPRPFGKRNIRCSQDGAADAAKSAPRRHDLAPNAGRETVDEIERAVDDEEPGEEEVPAPAGGEILVARERGPIRKAARADAFVLRRPTTRSCRKLRSKIWCSPTAIAARRREPIASTGPRSSIFPR